MSMKDCIVNGLKDGDLTPEQAKQAQDIYEQREAFHKANSGDAQASIKASQETLEILEHDMAHKRRVLLLQKEKQTNIAKNLFGESGYKGGRNPAEGAKYLIARSDETGYTSVEVRQESIFRQFLSQMDDILVSFRARGIFGTHANADTLYQFVKELWGESTDSQAAKAMAESWRGVSDMARQMYNEAGGAIPKLDTWRLPQKHNMIAVMKGGRDAWIKFVTPLLDTNVMKNEKTGKLFTPQELDLALNEVFETISESGWNKIKPTGQLYTGHKSLANRYTDHRFLIFKSADAWMAYQKEFGSPDVFNTMISYLHRMSHDIAMMQVLGPNPHSTMNFIRQSVLKDAAEQKVKLKDQKIYSKAERTLDRVDSLFEFYRGASFGSNDSDLIRYIQDFQNVTNSAFLGSTVLTSLSDVGFQRKTAKTMNMALGPLVKQILRNLDPMSVAERGREAARMGILMETWIGLAQAQARFAGEIDGHQWSKVLSDVVMRASGLSPWTQAGKMAMGFEIMSNLAKFTKNTFDEIPEGMRSELSKYGFNADNWEMIRKTPLYEYKGVQFLRPDDIRLASHIPKADAQEIALRYLDMVSIKTSQAVPTVGIESKEFLMGGTRLNPIIGTIAKSFSMFKNFSVEVANTHIRKALAQSTNARKAGYIGDLILGLTLISAISIQLKEISKGRDPRPMNTLEFWGASLLQGGGLGIWGDFLFSNTNRYGGGLEDTIAGPIVNFLNSAKNLTYGNIKQYINGEDTNVAREALDMLESYFPGKSIWYLNLLFKRGLFENIQLWNDPKYQQRLNRMENKYRRETGQEYWWRPGQLTPDRAPEISSETLLTQ